MSGTHVCDMSGRPPLRASLPEHLLRATEHRLQCVLGSGIQLKPWQADEDDGEILLVAPHELTRAELGAVLTAVDWSWVHLTSAGVDFVDLAHWPPDRLLTRSWQCYAAPLAEYVLGALLAHEWRHGAPWGSDSGPEGNGIWGAEIGIAGWGPVGQRVAHVTTALGASVRVLSRSWKPSSAQVRHTTVLDDLLDCDHLVVALPLTTQTRRLLGCSELRRARAGMHLINVSRAAIVDQDALAIACADRRLFATLDVTDPEPLPPDHPLRSLYSVRVSPHIAWRSRGSDGAFVEDFLMAWSALAAGADHIPGRAGTGTAARARAAVASTSAPPAPEQEAHR